MTVLSPEQQHLIQKHVISESPLPAPAYILWLFFGFIGAHRFYLKRYFSGAVMALLLVLGSALLICGILFGGTMLDGVFYEPDISDILRAAQSTQGRILFNDGALILTFLAAWWVIDGFLLNYLIRCRRKAIRQSLITFFQTY